LLFLVVISYIPTMFIHQSINTKGVSMKAIIVLALCFLFTGVSQSQVKFAGRTLTADTTQVQGAKMYHDSLGNKYEQIILLPQNDGSLLSDQQELYLPLDLGTLTAARYQYLRSLIQVWKAESDYKKESK